MNLTKQILVAGAWAIYLVGPCLADDYVVAVPPGLAEDQMKEIRREIEHLAFNTLDTDSTLKVIDSTTGKEVATFSVPEGRAYEQANYRRNAFASQLNELRRHLQSPAKDAQSSATFAEFMVTLSGKRDTPLHVLYAGSPLNGSMKGFEFLAGRYPSDGHLSADPRLTPLSTATKNEYLKNVRIHFLALIEPGSWDSPAHKDRVNRFWSLFIQSQGGMLVTTTDDVRRAFARLIDTQSEPLHQFALDETRNQVAMLKIDARDSIPDVVVGVGRKNQLTASMEEQLSTLKEKLEKKDALFAEIEGIFPELIGPDGKLTAPKEELYGLEEFSRFKHTPHPRLAATVSTGWSYHRTRWPKFDTAWCYMYRTSSEGVQIKVDIGDLNYGQKPIWSMPSPATLNATSLTQADILAARSACQFSGQS